MPIAFDNAAAGFGTATANPSFSYTCSGSNRLLVLFLDRWSTASYPTSITYNGTAMTLAGTHSVRGRWTVYYLLNPDTGSNTLAINGLPSTKHAYAAVSYTGVKQSAFPDASVYTGQVTGTTATSTLATVANDCWVICGGMFEASVANEPAAGTATTRRAGTNNSTVSISLSAFDSNSAKNPAGNVTIEETSAASRTHNFLTLSIAPAGSSIDINDTFVLSDSIKKTPIKVFSDTFSLSDTLSTLKSLTKSVSDSIALSDTLSRTLSRGVSDTINLADNVVKIPIRVFTDTISLADSLSSLKVTLVSLSDSITLSDEVVKTAVKVLSETIALTEGFMATSEKYFSDTISLADSAVALSVRFVEFTDTITLSDIMNKSNFLRVMDTILLVDEFRNRSWTRRVKPAEGTWTPRTKPPE